MKHISFIPSYFMLLFTISIITGILILININLYSANATNSSQSNQQDQQIITNIIKNINNNNNNISAANNNTSNYTNFSPISNIKAKKVTVGDIDIAYKIFGKGEPILLISESGNVMDVWPSYLLQKLSSTPQVIIFDNRWVGNTTSGIKPFSIEQFANDTAGLMDVLKIQKADILGFSMASFVGQQLTHTSRKG